MKKRRTEITIEIDEVLLLRKRRGPIRIWCSACAKEVTMVTPEQAAGMVTASLRTINLWVESGRVHFRETPDGLLLLCADSLGATNKAPGPTGPSEQRGM